MVSERGSEFRRQKTGDVDKLLDWPAEGGVGYLASSWGLKNRVKGHDSRSLWFKEEVELLKAVGPSWACRKET